MAISLRLAAMSFLIGRIVRAEALLALLGLLPLPLPLLVLRVKRSSGARAATRSPPRKGSITDPVTHFDSHKKCRKERRTETQTEQDGHDDTQEGERKGGRERETGTTVQKTVVQARGKKSAREGRDVTDARRGKARPPPK